VDPTSFWGGQLVDQCSAKHCMVCMKFPETWASNHRQRPSSSTRPSAKHRGSSATASAGSRDRAPNTLDRLDGIRGGPGSLGPSKCPDGRLSGGAKGEKAGGRAEEFAQSNWPTGRQNHQPTATPPPARTTALRCSRHLPRSRCEGPELAIAGVGAPLDLESASATTLNELLLNELAIG